MESHIIWEGEVFAFYNDSEGALGLPQVITNGIKVNLKTKSLGLKPCPLWTWPNKDVGDFRNEDFYN